MITAQANTQATIWSRILDPDHGDLTAGVAEFLLNLDFTDSDQRRIRSLNEMANEGTLTDAERAELEEFVRVGDILTILQSKARRSLAKHGQSA